MIMPFCFFNTTATTKINTYCNTVPLHAALPFFSIGKEISPSPVYVIEGQGCKEIVAPNTCSECHAERTGRKVGQWSFHARFEREVAIEDILVVMDR